MFPPPASASRTQGVGKGRELAAIIWENWIRGRKRAVWCTCNTDLLVDAQRDLKDIGAKHIPIKCPSQSIAPSPAPNLDCAPWFGAGVCLR